MTIFTVVVTSEATPGAFQERLSDRRFASNHILVIPNVWLVAGRGSAQDISGELGISDGSVASGVVSSMNGYFGRASANLWDWIKTKWEETSTGE
jgi:hypothetical protein